MQQKPKNLAAPTPLMSKTTAPSPVLLTRIIKRFTAYCPVGDGSCEFNVRKAPDLHTSKGAAQVETGRHVRAAHADMLYAERAAKRQRQVVAEQIALVE